MKLLALDTSTFTASAALLVDGAVITAEAVRTTTHSEELMPLIDRMVATGGLRARDLDAIAVGAGPGSFTGLRIGMATAKGIAFAAGRPLWAVSSLAALAHAAVRGGDRGLIVPVIDARRHEIYAGCYRAGGPGVVAAAPERVFPPAQLADVIAAVREPDEPLTLIGDLVPLAPVLPLLAAPRQSHLATPGATDVALLAYAGEQVDVLAHGAPVYLRPSEAEVMYPAGIPGALRRR